tara:strand:+ start:5039 stop:5929 length:891 start_codon:yes stop_codon:yes gene_type:complete
MATFFYYNIQALPIEKDNDFIGEKGYKSLFTKLSKLIKAKMAKKELHKIAIPLRNDYYFVPTKIVIKDGYAYGYFRKYDKVDSLEEFYSEENVFIGKKDQLVSSRSFKFPFVFDFKTHILAIGNKNSRLPNVNVLEEILGDFFTNFIYLESESHCIECICLKEATSINTVLAAGKYKSIKTVITFSNPQDVEDYLDENIIEEDLRNNSVNKLTTIHQSSKNGNMTGLTKLAEATFRLATKYGDATACYWSNVTNKFENFDLKNFPVKIPILKKDESESTFFSKIRATITRANQRTK